jgi:prevent-host-death family protein
MKTYSVSHARKHFAEVLETVVHGEEVTITRHGEPIAAITQPAAGKNVRPPIPPPGFLKAEGWQIEMSDDFNAVPKGFDDQV